MYVQVWSGDVMGRAWAGVMLPFRKVAAPEEVYQVSPTRKMETIVST